MKQFYTSYYAKSGTDPNAIRVSASAPSFYEGLMYPMLFPTWDMIIKGKSGDITFEEYSKQYHEEILDALDPQTVYDKLPDGAILLCYEKDPSCCHRTLIANWLHKHTGVIIKEIEDDVDNQDKILKLLDIDT